MYDKRVYVATMQNANLLEAPDVWEGVIDRHVPAGTRVETGFPGIFIKAPEGEGKYRLWEQTRMGVLFGWRWEREESPVKVPSALRGGRHGRN